MSDPLILTIGHSNHTLPRFLELIADANVSAIADVRSQPVSRWVPHFNRDRLRAALQERGMAYLYLGRELGDRPDDPSQRKNGRPDYPAMAKRPAFAEGLACVIAAGATERIALLCAPRNRREIFEFSRGIQ